MAQTLLDHAYTWFAFPVSYEGVYACIEVAYFRQSMDENFCRAWDHVFLYMIRELK
jgi:hypothetical protein